ncbi:polysaccharide pyruvyl transferase family protein [Pseudoalteromonas sp. NZS100]|uniref:polysaccharide pyruvyl transferase family protein n=1 Tax=Pseudoalteromonas sp. NZS100 TaxID=2792046 RepID=UPI0018CF8A4D|nr:polysaccharide pyruvyl transferase family protein [Pseudoalteromonas sp. NZS100]MBH0066687.1 polysaccharide pyruvyl transferase family protein [Pseudoalteromonas sp. NZS100]
MLYVKSLKNKVNFFSSFQKAKNNNVYVGYLGRNNYGDDLLFDIHEKINADRYLACLDTFKFQQSSPLNNLVLGGGTIINGEIYLNALKKFGKSPSYTFCSGVIGDKLSTEWVKTLENTNVYTRSEESAKKCIKSGVDAQALVDPGAFTSLLYPVKNQKAQDQVTVTVCPHGKHSSFQYYQNLIQSIQKISNSSVILFAASFEDLPLCNKLSQTANCKVVAGWKDIGLSNQIIGTSNLVISTRLHPSVVAASYGVPFFMISYEKKQQEFLNSIGADNKLYNEKDDITGLLEKSIGDNTLIAGMSEWQKKYPDFLTKFSK